MFLFLSRVLPTKNKQFCLYYKKMERDRKIFYVFNEKYIIIIVIVKIIMKIIFRWVVRWLANCYACSGALKGRFGVHYVLTGWQEHTGAGPWLLLLQPPNRGKLGSGDPRGQCARATAWVDIPEPSIQQLTPKGPQRRKRQTCHAETIRVVRATIQIVWSAI